MAHKIFIIFLVSITVAVAVESNSSVKLNVQNDNISESNVKDVKDINREKRQINYIYYVPYPYPYPNPYTNQYPNPYPNNGYQSYYVKPAVQTQVQPAVQTPINPTPKPEEQLATKPIRRPVRQPTRKPTTQGYSIWDISRKRRSADLEKKVVNPQSTPKLNVKNDNKSEFTDKDIKQPNRQQRQINYIYYYPYPYPYPNNGYQSFYVQPEIKPNRRPVRQPTRKPATQGYSIWDLSRKRRSAENFNEKSTDTREKRQIDDADDDNDYYPYYFPQFFSSGRNFAQPRNQPYTVWDLTRRKRNV